jgi:hypothetical protein
MNGMAVYIGGMDPSTQPADSFTELGRRNPFPAPAPALRQLSTIQRFTIQPTNKVVD